MIERNISQDVIDREFRWWAFKLTVGFSIAAILTGWAIAEVLMWVT